jgi:hypothetical protein
VWLCSAQLVTVSFYENLFFLARIVIFLSVKIKIRYVQSIYFKYVKQQLKFTENLLFKIKVGKWGKFTNDVIIGTNWKTFIEGSQSYLEHILNQTSLII